MNNLLFPIRTKYKKQHKRNYKLPKEPKLNFGEIGIYTLEPFWFTSKQIEACRKTILKYTKRTGKIFIKIFPDQPITKRTEDSRMGTGKGSVDHWVSLINKGKMLFELKDIPLTIAKQALKQVMFKLPVKTKIYEKNRYSTISKT